MSAHWGLVLSEAPKALAGLYGSKERKQETFTPMPILDAIARVWPEGIALDPCGHPEAPLICDLRLYVPDTVSGLEYPWEPRTYLNPPFNNLKDWLLKTMEEYADGIQEIMVLSPCRSRRVWSRQAFYLADRICYLDPVTFVGYPSTHPEDMCIRYYGTRIDAFNEAFSILGDCTKWS